MKKSRRPAGALCLGAGPVRFDIHARDGEFRSVLEEFFRSFGPPPPRPDGVLRYEFKDGALSRNGIGLGKFRKPIRGANRIVLDLGEQVPSLARRHLCLHAGVVALRGRALLLPAALKGGKSTLTLGLVRNGCTYYTDDVAILGLSRGRLAAFPRPIDLREGVVDLFPRLGPGLRPFPLGGGASRGRVSVRVDRRRTGRSGAKVRWVVFPHVRLGRPTRMTPLRRGEALLRLCRQAFNLDRLGEGGFEALVSLVGGAECFALEVGRLPAGLRALCRLMGRKG